jgi:hypothetical protein
VSDFIVSIIGTVGAVDPEVWLKSAVAFMLIGWTATAFYARLVVRQMDGAMIQYDAQEQDWRDTWEYEYNRRRLAEKALKHMKAEKEQWKECSEVNQENKEEYRHLYVGLLNVAYILNSDNFVILQRNGKGRFSNSAKVPDLIGKYAGPKAATIQKLLDLR